MLANDGRFHIIFDNDATIASIDTSLVKEPANRIVCVLGAHFDEEYGFEDITYNDRLERYYTLIETFALTPTATSTLGSWNTPWNLTDTELVG